MIPESKLINGICDAFRNNANLYLQVGATQDTVTPSDLFIDIAACEGCTCLMTSAGARAIAAENGMHPNLGDWAICCNVGGALDKIKAKCPGIFAKALFPEK